MIRPIFYALRTGKPAYFLSILCCKNLAIKQLDPGLIICLISSCYTANSFSIVIHGSYDSPYMSTMPMSSYHKITIHKIPAATGSPRNKIVFKIFMIRVDSPIDYRYYYPAVAGRIILPYAPYINISAFLSFISIIEIMPLHRITRIIKIIYRNPMPSFNILDARHTSKLIYRLCSRHIFSIFNGIPSMKPGRSCTRFKFSGIFKNPLN